MPNTQIIIIIFTSYTKKRLTSLYVLFSVQLIRDDYPLQMKLEHFQLTHQCMYKILSQSCVCLDPNSTMKTDGYVSFKIPERFIVFLRPPLAFSTIRFPT